MNKVKVVYRDNGVEVVEKFDNVVGNQVGGGAVQVVMSNGTQRIINNFTAVDVIPDEETMKQSLKLAERAYGDPEEVEIEREDPKTDKVTPIK